MKRFLALLAACAALMGATPVGRQISTRAEKLSDFHIRVTKVVLSGNLLQDVALKEAVRNAWTISSYEFCSTEEFEALKTSGDYYFMLRTRDEGKPGLSFLTLVKGGSNDLRTMLEVFSMPIGSADGTREGEEVFLSALMGIMQENVEKSLYRTGVKLKSVPGGLSRLSKMKLYINSEDLSGQVDDGFKATGLGKDMYIIDPYGAEDIIMSGSSGTAVTYLIAPSQPIRGATCYKLVLDARTQELLWLGKHKIRSGRGSGFLKGDLKKLSRYRR